MRQILCYGDSNTWGCIPVIGPDPPRRFQPDERWPGVLRRELGDGYWIVEDGLNGRTTVWDDGLEPHANGRRLLLPLLFTHQPLDLVILMLGTNDLKRRFGVSAAEVAEGVAALVDVVGASGAGPAGAAPHVLVISPPPLGRLGQFADVFEGADRKSRQLADVLGATAALRGCAFLDAGAHVASSDVDGIHLDREAHAALGVVVAREVLGIVE